MAPTNQPSNLLDKIAELERQIAEIRAKVGLSSATVTRGILTVKDGAEFAVEHPAGHNMFLVGRAPGYDPYQVVVRRDDGSVAWAMATETGGTNQQLVLHFDRAGNVLVADDPITGSGLARPHLDMPMYPGPTNSWQTTTSATFETLWTYGMEAQHPYLSWAIGVTDSGADGEIRVQVNGSTISSLYSYTAGAPTSYGEDLPHGVTMQLGATVEIQARRTAGAGSLYVRPWHLRGVGQWA